MKTIISEKITNNIKITTYSDGSEHFEVIKTQTKSKLNFFQKIIQWFKKHEVKPYIKNRDLADPFGDRKKDPFDTDSGSDGITGTEVGIEIKF